MIMAHIKLNDAELVCTKLASVKNAELTHLIQYSISIPLENVGEPKVFWRDVLREYGNRTLGQNGLMCLSPR